MEPLACPVCGKTLVPGAEPNTGTCIIHGAFEFRPHMELE